MSYIKSVRQLRAIFFGHTLADVAVCAAKGSEIARWGDTWWAGRTGREIPDPNNHKWPDYLSGSLPRSWLRAPLIADFPVLQTILDDPLWPLLQRLIHPDEDTGCWAAQLRLNGRSFRYFSATRLQRLCGVPHWRRLACLFALLASERPSDYASQKWLRRELTVYVLCACLELPGLVDPVVFYNVLEEANHQGKLGTLADWPKSSAEFRQKIQRLRRIQQRLHARGWIREWRHQERLLFWHLLREPLLLVRLLTGSPSGDLNRDHLCNRARLWLRQAQRDRVNFEVAEPGSWRWCDPTRGGSPPFAWVVPWA